MAAVYAHYCKNENKSLQQIESFQKDVVSSLELINETPIVCQYEPKLLEFCLMSLIVRHFYLDFSVD